MDKLIYIATSGSAENLNAQAKYMNNLANVGTTGFRAELETQQSSPVYGEGLATRVYATAGKSGYDFNSGPIKTTDRELDVAIPGEGWFVVQGADEKEGLTRAGALQITTNGALQTSSGQPVLGNGGAIVIPPASKIEIGADGTISYIPEGQDATTPVILDRLKLVNPDTTLLTRGSDGLFYREDGQPAEVDGNVRIVSGAIEGSNVNAIDAMVNILSLSRSFEMQVKLMKEAADNAEQSSQLIDMR